MLDPRLQFSANCILAQHNCLFHLQCQIRGPSVVELLHIHSPIPPPLTSVITCTIILILTIPVPSEIPHASKGSVMVHHPSEHVPYVPSSSSERNKGSTTGHEAGRDVDANMSVDSLEFVPPAPDNQIAGSVYAGDLGFGGRFHTWTPDHVVLETLEETRLSISKSALCHSRSVVLRDGQSQQLRTQSILQRHV